jgi:undecaprenyl pyrophosphate phosphatase UppP
MSVFATILFWFVTLTTCMSGFGFLFRIPKLYHPEAYMVDGLPGTGETGFEKVATFVFANVYLAPIAGVIYAFFFEGDSDASMRSACIAPMMYHVMSVVGVYFVFGEYLNPEVASIHTAASMHFVYAVLFGLLYWTATGDDNTRKLD